MTRSVRARRDSRARTQKVKEGTKIAPPEPVRQVLLLPMSLLLLRTMKVLAARYSSLRRSSSQSEVSRRKANAWAA